MIYREFRTWKKAVAYRLEQFFCGIYGLIVKCLIMGIVSVLFYCVCQIEAFFRRETIAASIVTALLFVITFGWIATFVNERQARVEAQHRADSLAYDISKLTQMFDTTKTLIINGDTIRNM